MIYLKNHRCVEQLLYWQCTLVRFRPKKHIHIKVQFLKKLAHSSVSIMFFDYFYHFFDQDYFFLIISIIFLILRFSFGKLFR